VLTRLDLIDGVECSFINEPGDLIRLSLRPGADPARVAGSARRVLRQMVQDRVPVLSGKREAAAALQREQWRDKSRAAEPGTAEPGSSVSPAPPVWPLWPVLLLGCLALGLGLVWWRHHRSRAGKEPAAHPSLRPTGLA
jgi:hypothetical protein